jgi:hypothetical protein
LSLRALGTLAALAAVAALSDCGPNSDVGEAEQALEEAAEGETSPNNGEAGADNAGGMPPVSSEPIVPEGLAEPIRQELELTPAERAATNAANAAQHARNPREQDPALRGFAHAEAGRGNGGGNSDGSDGDSSGDDSGALGGGRR